ncbi:MAG: GTPase ObgE [Myxococcus sp.]|nr:GTPase ObgE [Myxococcus sp.]
MKFVDEVHIKVKAGDGGNGAVAFRREKYVDKGGPSGGDGGNGGSVIFKATEQLTTLLDFRYHSLYRARNGYHGMGSDMNGAGSDDLILETPVGTLVRDQHTGEELVDLSVAGQTFVIAKGGRGGLGNINFATSTRQTPRFAQDGTPGQERDLTLELKLIADVGIVGFPNAGKSTLISRVSRARPKVADYPFTTLVPNLGVVPYKDKKSFVMADIPGLIEGASEGAGLGHQFLRHVERCRVLVHLVDLSAVIEGRDPVADFDTINTELKKYSGLLAQKPMVVVANKLDLPDARAALPKFLAAMQKRRIRVLELSGATGEGLQQLMDACAQQLFSQASLKTRIKQQDALRDVVTAETAFRAPRAEKPAAVKKKAKPAKKPAAAKQKTAPKKPAPKQARAKPGAAQQPQKKAKARARA